MNTHPCRECRGCGYAMTGGRCALCRGTGRAHVACADCRGGYRRVEGHFSVCATCRGYGRLDVVIDARTIDVQRERAASEGVAADVRRRVPMEAKPRRRSAPVEGAPETRLERDDEAAGAAREAWDAAEGSQVRRRARRARAA